MSDLSDFEYHLPEELIAQQPLAERSDSRLMVVGPADQASLAVADANGQASAGAQAVSLYHKTIRDLPVLLTPGDRLVFNDTRVIPARLFGRKASGGRLEMMLERINPNGTVTASLRTSRSPREGSRIILDGRDNASLEVMVSGRSDDLFELADPQGRHEQLADFIAAHGEIPLPPYINRKPSDADSERYQTVFAANPGAVAAPTAGLHFDQALLEALQQRGIERSFITLHVGAGTFQPVRTVDISNHVMHAERVHVSEQAVDEIRQTRSQGGRIIAVGTTCVRSLEAAAQVSGQLQPLHTDTRLFITPGFRFRVVDAMLTNFHLPGSTLLMLVSAFAGRDTIMSAYQSAVAERYRFFSYGDAMLLWPQQERVG